MGNINQTVEKLVNDLFADKLVAGLEATQKVSWETKSGSEYDPLTGEVSAETSDIEIPVIVGDFKSSEKETLNVNDELVLQMQPLENRTSKEALADSFLFDNRKYSVKSIEAIRLGRKVMLWKVRAS